MIRNYPKYISIKKVTNLMNESNRNLGIGTEVWRKTVNVNNNALLYWGVTKYPAPQGSIQSFLYILST